MRNIDLSIKIGGEAGMGVESGGAGLSKAFARAGFSIFSFQDIMSRIRGGHNFFQLRVSNEPLYSFSDETHILIAFTKECIEKHKHEVAEGGAILYDEKLEYDPAELVRRGVHACPIPLSKIAAEIGGSPLMANTCAISAAAGIAGLPYETLASVLRDNFGKKGGDLAEKNARVAEAGYEYGRSKLAFAFQHSIGTQAPNGAIQKKMVLNGNQALALGSMAGGCKFIAAYPMTPATSIFEYITAKASKYGIVSKQTEDEIAALLFAIGAAHAGARAMTTTSGGGFCLMVEALGLAAMTETPVVIVNVQRGGPSTGLPTRTEQPDLEFVVHSSHGESPRIVIAPATVEECFEAGWRAFNLAEKYQCPVIILSDLYLANQLSSVAWDRIDFSRVKIDRGMFISTERELKNIVDYKRHGFSDSGISARVIPGMKEAVFMTTSDEHDEYGHAVEDSEPRSKMMEKRMKKMEVAAKMDMKAPEVYGDLDGEVTFVCWGSVYGAAREAVDRLKAGGRRAGLLKFTDLWPFPEEKAKPLLQKARHLVAVENNYTGQLSHLIRRCTGIDTPVKILKYDGRPFSPDQIIANLKEEAHAHVRS